MKNFYNWLKSRIKIPVRVNTPRPYIIPTGVGFSYGLLVFILIIVSVNNKNNLILLFAFFLFSVGMVTLLLSHKNFEKIKITFKQASILFKNEVGILSYIVENPHIKESFMIVVADKTIEHIKSNEAKEVQIEFKSEHYGQIQVPMQKLESYFPLQFLRVWRFFQPEIKMTVYPEKVNYVGLLSNEPESEAGIKKQKNESVEKEISHFDRFQLGDSPQSINWKILAKTNELYINKFESLANEQEQIVIRWSDTEPLVDIEKRKSQMCYWIDHTYRLKKSFAVQFEDQDVFVSKSDQKSLVRALRLLL